MNNHVKGTIEGLKDEASAALREKLQKGWSSAVVQSKKAGKQINTYAQKNPWRIGLSALALGLLVGYFVSKPEMKKSKS